MMPGPAGPVRVNKRGVIVQKLSYPYHDDERYASLTRIHRRFQERQTPMNKRYVRLAPMLSVLLFASCAGTRHARQDLAHYTFPKAQSELRHALRNIINDGKTKDFASLRASHLNSEKFTKFGGRRFDRQDFDLCNEIEAGNAALRQDFEYDPKDLKIDVFGEVAIMTYYPHVSFKKDGEVVRYSSRQTLVFLKTADGWKIIHEHRTPKAWYEQ